MLLPSHGQLLLRHLWNWSEIRLRLQDSLLRAPEREVPAPLSVLKLRQSYLHQALPGHLLLPYHFVLHGLRLLLFLQQYPHYHLPQREPDIPCKASAVLWLPPENVLHPVLFPEAVKRLHHLPDFLLLRNTGCVHLTSDGL